MPETYLLKRLPGTKFVSPAELEIGDIILNDDGSFYGTVEDVFTDSYGTWVDDSYNVGYVSENVQYLIEWN
jgi:hypothetical protein